MKYVWWLTAVAAVLLILLAVGVYARYNPAASWFFPPCPVKWLTGLSCPACGLQRALHALLNGHFSQALGYNYFFVLSLPYAAALLVACALRALRRGPRLVAFIEHRYGVYTYLVLFCLWFVVRNALDL